MLSLRIFTLVSVIMIMVLGAVGANAQEEWHEPGEIHPGEEIPPQDTTVLPLVLPEMSDFAEAGSIETEAEGLGADVSGAIGGSAYSDFSTYSKSGSLAPAYTFSPAFKARLRIPLIFERTITYFDGEATTKGLGDMALDVEYKSIFARGELRFTGTMKFPTGDNEATDNNHVVALGTGSMDFLGKAQYSRSTRKSGYLLAALYRFNSGGEVTQPDLWDTGTNTTETTNGNLFVTSAFGRYNAKGPWWLHLGVSLALTGDGESTTQYTPTGGTAADPVDSVVQTKSSLVDIFPGISYNLGLIRPYLGARIPLVSSYDVENELFPRPDREVSLILQFTYNPKSMTQD